VKKKASFPSEGDVVRSHGEGFPCPFCGAEFHIGEDDEGPMSIIHEIPECREFIEAEDALDFVEQVNRRMRQ
jgi:hypothetical protein